MIKIRSKYFGICLLSLLFSAFPLAGYSQNSLVLSSTNVAPANSVRLHWHWTPAKPAKNYSFTLFQWEDALAIWQSTSVKCDDTIRVLNVYPNIESSNTLATWMHDHAIGFGKILVTSVSITNFNKNPNNYLKNGSGEYIYDVIMFGSFDRNNSEDLSSVSASAVRTFLNSGRGVLFGHDTQTSHNYPLSYGGQPNFISLRDKTNLDIDPMDDRKYLWRGSTSIKAINDGYLLKYPHLIPYNVNLTIPATHTTGQMAKGIVWMNFPNTVGAPSDFTAAPQILNGGTNNFYLTTWNNAAMIQTGHSGGTSTLDERKIIANTLWYLAQFTTDTTADGCSARDITPPANPTAIWGNDCMKINISARDSGTGYKFYLKATNMVDNSDTVKSNVLTVENKTGICGYFISEDMNINGIPPISRDASNNITTPLTLTASDNQQVSYAIQNPSSYIHIQAIDCAGNLSQVTTIKAVDAQIRITLQDTVCQYNAYSKHGFDIPANELQTVGIHKFKDSIPNTTGGCDTVINLIISVMRKDTLFIFDTICEGNTYSKYNFNASDTGIYMQNLLNRFNCDSTVILNLAVIPQLDTVFISDSICEGETYKKYGFNASQTDIYTKNLQNRFNCDSIVVLDLKVNPKPYVEISATTENFCEKDFIELELTTNGTSFSWNTGSTDNPITIYKSGVYLVTAFLGDCEEKASYTLEECPCLAYIPNAFTPNGDGVNDVFKPSLSCYETLKSYRLSIYDRWGNLIFSSSDYATGWDGTTYNGGTCAEGVYNAVIAYTTSKNEHVVKNISITLLR